MLKIYSDGAVSQQQKLAGMGLLIVGDGLHEQLAFPLPDTLDNHLAELHAFHEAVKWVVEHDRVNEWTIFHTDSQLVAQSVNKQYIKNEDYQPIFEKICFLLKQLTLYDVVWIPEKNNRGADNLAKQAIRAQVKK
ncbi:MAG: ribonuclease HI family protein [Alkalibacterium sp.]|nr:ribonuclease HI family protein [Alkalibacterium sp.]TVP91500.1 MAG: reverse transcriptase-like protein [Alkalibacterium sp.]